MASMSERDDALKRAVRSGAQGLLLTALVGAAATVDQVAGAGETLTLQSVVAAAALGAGYSAAAWAHRRLEAALHARRRRAAENTDS